MGFRLRRPHLADVNSGTHWFRGELSAEEVGLWTRLFVEPVQPQHTAQRSCWEGDVWLYTVVCVERDFHQTTLRSRGGAGTRWFREWTSPQLTRMDRFVRRAKKNGRGSASSASKEHTSVSSTAGGSPWRAVNPALRSKMHTIREWAAICHPSPMVTQKSDQQEVQFGPGSLSSESPEEPQAHASEGSTASSDSDGSPSFGMPGKVSHMFLVCGEFQLRQKRRRRRKPQTRGLELGNVKVLRRLAGRGPQAKDMSFAAWRRRAMLTSQEVPVEEERLPASALRVAIASVRGAVHWGADDEHNNS
mmetsp:Transcript_9369/g.20431  ORF Transcript_9369/g.20431 Transcript_9369/m.20431 type:complete len:304 (-) Transcript_9369:3-914(-)